MPLAPVTVRYSMSAVPLLCNGEFPATAHEVLSNNMFVALLMPQGVGYIGVGLLTCGTALLSMKWKPAVDEEDPEPNPDPPACAGCGASPPEGKRRRIDRPRCED